MLCMDGSDGFVLLASLSFVEDCSPDVDVVDDRSGLVLSLLEQPSWC